MKAQTISGWGLGNIHRGLAASLFVFLFFCHPAIVDAEPEAGQFDYYLLTLSWSPAFCAAHGKQSNASEQCGAERFGFVVHGLWPQYERGYPESCQADNAELPKDVVTQVLSIMPSHPLIEHEWEKHGTCSGLDAAGYFGFVEQLFAGITVPDLFDAPKKAFRIAPEKIRRAFLTVNPALMAEAIVVPCKGKFLEEVRICYDKSGVPTACAGDVTKTACKRTQLVVQP